MITDKILAEQISGSVYIGGADNTNISIVTTRLRNQTAGKYVPNLSKDPKIDTTPVDTIAPLDVFAKDGYYVVDNKIFRHKVYAMQDASRKSLKPTDVKWVFNEHVFDKIDWKTSNHVPLLELYRRRAQQLREKYSYLVLAFSGGGDSTNVMDSFILNNIHLDEVVVHWPRHLTAGRYTPNLSSDATNFMSEWDYLVEPKLKWLEKTAPKTKITIVDNMMDLRPKEPGSNLVTLSSRHTYNGHKRYQAWDDVLLERQKVHKNCAIIQGVGPPRLVTVGRHLMTYFTDLEDSRSDITDQGLHRNVEFFYCTPDMPEIVREQTHACLQGLRAKPAMIDYVGAWAVDGKFNHKDISRPGCEIRRRWIKSILYPTYDYTQLQVNKPLNHNHRSEWFSWLYDNPHSKEIVQPHISAITSHENIIDPSFFVKINGVVVRYVEFKTKMYHIGDI